MLKFLRRVFVLLVLFTIIFVIFRIAKPTATSNFVEKVKAIPQTISSRFHKDGKKNNESELTIKSNTTKISGDIVSTGWQNETWDSIEDLARLEELNQEIETILNESTWDTNSWTNQDFVVQETTTGTQNENENLEDITISEIVIETWNIETGNNNSMATTTDTTTENTTTNTTQTNTQTSSNSNKTYTSYWDCWKPFTQAECDEMRRLWSYFD